MQLVLQLHEALQMRSRLRRGIAQHLRGAQALRRRRRNFLPAAVADQGELLLGKQDERGGEIASRLQGIYAFCRRHLIEAAAEQDPNKIEEVSELLGELREAWAEIAGSES